MSEDVTLPETDIAKLALDALNTALAPEAVKKIVDDRIQKTVSEAIDAATRSYSPFGKQLEEKIKSALDLNNLELPTYSVMITTMVSNHVQALVADTIKGRMESDLVEILSLAPKEIRLSTLIEGLVKSKEDEGEYGEVVTCWVEEFENYSSSDLWGPNWRIYLDETTHWPWADRDKSDIVIEVRHGIKDRDTAKDGIITGTVSSVTNNGRQIAGIGTSHVSKAYGLEQRLIGFYAAETVMTVDEDEVCISAGDY